MNDIITTGVLIYGKSDDESIKQAINLCKRLCLKHQYKYTNRDDPLFIVNKYKLHGFEAFQTFLQNKYRIL
jgi:hypothetical protein